ncbi:hypothetical protein DV736_g2617, partial [Chaetothyriales sp. CBS 134916]
MAPAKRKQGAGVQSASKKAQRQDKSKAKVEVEVPIDDAFSEELSASVYIDDDGTIFDASLNQTNIGNNNNKFYFLQLIKSKNGKKFYVHTRWGRVGDFGQAKTIGPQDLDGAMADFMKKFKEKSGLPWDKRYEEPEGGKKYTFLEKCYEDEKEEAKMEKAASVEDTIKSTLPLQTQRLIELIFNENHFNSVLEDIGYNRDKLPLGKLGKTTLRTGFKHLQELASLIKHPSLAQNKYGKTQKAAVEDLSNRYYSTIPHITGRQRPPLIDNNEILRREEVANAIMKANNRAKDAASLSLIDNRFNDLHLKEMTPLNHKGREYKGLAKYLLESTGSTHSIRYQLEDIFRIEREGETDRFEKSPWSKIQDKNRLLLWHGSRTTNFGGILSQGLRIAPPEAPMSGYAFGKGVYLADCSSKSANYCRASMSGGTGLLLLCEAELARPMYEIPTGDPNAQAQAKKFNCFSTKGVGKTVPQKWKDAGCLRKDLRGVLMPDGPVGDNKLDKSGYLLYNEYICYDVAQLRLRYLFRVTMN